MPSRLLPRCMSRRLFRGGSESGLTLIELMVSLVVFAIAATAIFAGLISVMQTTRSSRNRLQASSLASREMEIVRNEFGASTNAALTLGAANEVTNPHPLPGGVAGAALSVDGSPYTVVRNVEWLAAGTGQSACDGGASLTYPSLAVNVSVTWPRMGQVKPVVSNTVLTPPKNTVSSTLAFVGVKVVDLNNSPEANQVVTLNGPVSPPATTGGASYTDTTGADGCAVFALTTASVTTTYNYTASLNTSGYVDKIGVTNPSQSVSVKSGVLTQTTFNYDRAVSLAVTLATDSGYALPTSAPQISFYNTLIQPLGVKAVANGGSVTTISNLWPYSDGYVLWAGSCKQSDPTVAAPPPLVPPFLGVRDPAVVLAPGASAVRTIRLAPVQVNVTLLGVALSGVTVTATPPSSTTNCVAPDTMLTLGVTSSGVLMTSLPVGKWTLNVIGKIGAVTTSTLLQTSAASSYALSVS
jgi:prepilin-type N-terminal cleavage/methylation domain-containing protein